MKRKLDYPDIKPTWEIFPFIQNIFGYKVTKFRNEIVFDLLKNCDSTENKKSGQHILIYNISVNLTEENLLPFLFKITNFDTIRCLKINKRLYILGTENNQTKIIKTWNILDNYETIQGDTISTIICRDIYKIYIANIKVQTIGFYTIQSKLLSLLIGLQKITFYSIDKYKRYCVVLQFFENSDTELSLKLLTNDYLFQENPEILVDIKYEINLRTEPAVIFEWNEPRDSQNVKPNITILDILEARNLQNY